jgi:hypothetical protein
MRITRVERHEFETEDGTVYPIDPPLDQDMTPEEFERHYGKATEFIKSLDPTRSNN